MKVPLSWLKDYVDVNVSVDELAERLTLAGLEVETIEYIGLPGADLPWDPEKIVVAEVQAIRPHPDADRLVLVDVAYGGEEVETAVTGAPSLVARQGESDLHLKVAFATEGAQLYNGHTEGWEVITLREARIRGVPSRAMVCSQKELGISEEHEDILYLPDDAPVGTPLVDYIGDAVLEFDIKGPFAHLHSIVGVAREAAALLGVPLKRDVLTVRREQEWEIAPATPFIDLEIADPELCPRYSAALIEDVAVGPSPFWMQLRLQRAGMRPINNIVDVTNYVMLELGQPLHAFDYHLLHPRPDEERPAIIIRCAEPDEQMRTLDGELRTFDEQMLLITDGQGPVAVAGVMGGMESEVSEGTQNVLLESANFHFLNVRRTSRMLGLNSEASQRFGRRVDPELTVKAAARAADLMAEVARGSVAGTIADLYPGRKPGQVIDFDPADAARILGVEIPVDEMVRILNSLEFEVAQEDGHLRVSVPSHRRDVTQPVDLVEEVGRIWGYDRFPTTLMRDELPPLRANPYLEGTERTRDILVGCGLDEVITYSLIDIADEARLRPQGPPPDPEDYLQVRNPLSSERAYLRQTLLPSLFEVTRENLRFLDRVSIFEVGATYVPVADQALPQEQRYLCAVMTGPREAQSWLPGQDRSAMDFYDVKGVVETLVQRMNLRATFTRGEHPALHPGRCAQLEVESEAVGVLGEVHPLVREAFELPDQPVCAVELNLDRLLAAWSGAGEMKPLSTHPPVYEDLAFIVDEGVPAARVRALIEQTGRPLLRSVMLFDVYRGEQVGRERKSLAYRLTYQAQDKTLTDRAVAKVRERIVKRLEKEVGATLRSS